MIDNEVFAFCSSLKEIIIPDKVRRIGEGAFFHCKSLEYVELPSSLVAIAEWGLTSV